MILAINKPKGPTSHDIIDAIRRVTGEKRVGHAGTLDPLASGVLVVAIGREDTKKLSHIVKNEKEYTATIKLGVRSTTDDEEGEKTAEENVLQPTEKNVRAVLEKFVGIVEQVPPIYSAVKIKGTPSHRRVRRGEEVKLKARAVEIKKIELINYTWPNLTINVTTGPGVYIRSLARDIGGLLGTGGYLAELERKRVGDYTLETAITIEAFKKTHNGKI